MTPATYALRIDNTNNEWIVTDTTSGQIMIKGHSLSATCHWITAFLELEEGASLDVWSLVVAVRLNNVEARRLLSERENSEGGATQAQRRRGTGWSHVAETPVAETDAGFMAGGRIVVGASRSESSQHSVKVPHLRVVKA